MQPLHDCDRKHEIIDRNDTLKIYCLKLSKIFRNETSTFLLWVVAQFFLFSIRYNVFFLCPLNVLSTDFDVTMSMT